MNKTHYSKLSKILSEVIPQGYYVGGIVRNSLLRRNSSDIDIALPKENIQQVAYTLGKKLNAAVFEMDSEYGIWRLVTHKDKLQIDLTSFQGKDLKEDLLRRDFTLNAMAYPLSACPTIEVSVKKGQTPQIILKKLKRTSIIDYVEGLVDLKNKQIVPTNPNVFTDDPIRMLRAFRMSAELGFDLHPQALTLIQAYASLIDKSAGERIHEELERLFETPKSYKFICLMDKCGLLTEIFPELEPQRTCAEVYYGEGGVFKHTLEVFNRIEYLLENLHKAFPKYADKLMPFIANKPLYKMTALLHDIAKPATAKVVGDRLRFFYHEQKGAKMAKVVLERLHYSKVDIRLICAMIEEHLRPSNLASNNVITDRGAYHFFRDLGEAAIPMLLLCWADYASYVTPAQLRYVIAHSVDRMMNIAQAQRKANIGKTLRHMQVLNLLFSKYFDHSKKIQPSRIITGRDIMQVLNLPPSPKIGELLEAVAEAQVEGKVTDKESAIEFLKQLPLK